ncbi:MAG: VWA domain-containing protein [Acidobacteria bacterium]|nr:VWA domain-containing protein [Acidobacteriota bacterium]MYD71726.1 VWA domain-containing protein [Acidobacteriota bacterium]MYJ05900.1 VWA domain-containing protein [Acidobacteriota bacterium]
MNGRQRLVPSLALLLLASVAIVAAQQQPMFRSGTQLVDLYVTVTDRDGRLVPNLTREDFAIFDDEEPTEIVLFENSVRPITVVVMLDTSASMDLNRDRLMAGAEQFLLRLLPADRARVGAFNDKLEINPPQFIGDRDALIAELPDLGFGNSTRVYDAAYVSLDALTGVDGRRVILLFSDGDDTDSDVGAGNVVDRAVAEEVMIYSIGFESNYFNGIRYVTTRPDRNLRRFAEETGGGYFELTEAADLGPTFTRVARELHSQYVLGFTPRTDGQLHDIRVLLTQRGLTARARRSYLAPSSNAVGQ